MRMKPILFLLLLAFWFTASLAQQQLGMPEIVNYGKHNYNAGTQNWDIVQDVNGILYFANNEGLLTFDGTYWKTYPLTNKTIVRSIAIGTDQRIYAGAQDEIGFYTPNKNGQLAYQSLLPLIPEAERSFADVWDIVVYKKAVFFRSARKIFQYTEGKIISYPGTDWQFMGCSNNQLLAQDAGKGLLVFENGLWTPLAVQTTLPASFLVTSFLAVGKDSTLLTTLKDGCFLLTRGQLQTWQTPALETAGAKKIYAATPVGNNYIALATTLDGCYVINKQGQLVSHFSRREGLQNNNVLSVFADKNLNLWLGLDNGIDLISYNNALRHIYPDSDKDLPGYSSLIYQNKLYLGTSNGLYVMPLSRADMYTDTTPFTQVNNTAGQVWNLSEVNGKLLLGHHEGSFVVENNAAVALDKSTGFWTFLPFSPVLPSPLMVAGTYDGIRFYQFQEGRFSAAGKVPFESARFVFVDGQNVWVSHPYKGIFRIVKKDNAAPQVITYAGKKWPASPHNTHLFKIRNRVVATTESGLFEYNEDKDQFEPSVYFNRLFGGLNVRYLKEDGQGNIWFVYQKNLGVVDMTGAQPAVIFIPELNNKMISGFEHINPVDPQHIFIGGEKGFYLLNFEQYKRASPALQAGIRSVYMHRRKDSLLFGGYFGQINTNSRQQGSLPGINHDWNTLRFEFSSAQFGQQASVEYSYRLKGLMKEWSEWTKKTDKEFTNLPAGTYTFEVKARSNLGNKSAVASYSFVVLPPWYLTRWAFLFYGLMAVSAFYLGYVYQKRKFQRQRIRHETEQKRLQYFHQLELEKNEKQIMQLKNEKLEAEIQHKNKELASAAMHLVQKGELLSKIKDELVKIKKLSDNGKQPEDVKKIIKILNEEEKLDKDWEHFSIHFDKVHSDFLIALKQLYPALTANELKLCAYLRMNLSTKEIAQLMNISVRGVEISRYRLRKKLEIPTETNLFHFLLNVCGNPAKENQSVTPVVPASETIAG